MTHSFVAYQNSVTPESLAEHVDFYRIDALRHLLDPKKKSEMGQFMTSSLIAKFMASLFREPFKNIHVLDAGAGVGSLTAAFVEEFCKRPAKTRPKNIQSTAYELDLGLSSYLKSTITYCQESCQQKGISFEGKILQEDFIEDGVAILNKNLFTDLEAPEYTHAILNPPYKKIRSSSVHRKLLSSIGIETSNFYTAFLVLAVKLLTPGGELVAITPRSFCNGPYFKPFRKIFFDNMVFRQIHVFASRNKAFKDDEVLQENIIFYAVKNNRQERVTISASNDSTFEGMTVREVDYSKIINPNDPDKFIHIATSDLDQNVVDRINFFGHTLDDIGVNVSTGRVVDFRAKKYLRTQPKKDTVPLIYPTHFQDGFINWHKEGIKKPNALISCKETEKLMLPAGCYVLVKRFSAKEEKRRLVASIYDSDRIISEVIGFENHLNVFHIKNKGLPLNLAKGLSLYLNSTLLDTYFRQFNGHTQVNATDLKIMRYPSVETLNRLGSSYEDIFPLQTEIDNLIEQEILKTGKVMTPDPNKAKQKTEEALNILKQLGLPKGQLNDRSALTLLALLNLKPEMSWSEAGGHLIGITPIMEICKNDYGRQYAPNSRETFRRFTMHQFVEAGLAVQNPDQPDRPVNSPKWCYQIEFSALELLKQYKTTSWDKSLKAYLKNIKTLKERYARERKMNMIPVTLTDGRKIQLTPGKHSELIKNIILEFGPRFVPGGKVIYVGDTGDKWGYFDKKSLKKLGVKVDLHGKMPDTVIYYPEREWILLIEAVTSHGPVDSKRQIELKKLFENCEAGLVYVTAFPSRTEMSRYLGEISWETEVWVADAPSHLIHFNGERFLGPYDK